MKPSFFQLYTAAESRHIDKATISEFGIDGFTLMELAATSATREIIIREKPGSRVLAICGKGNNAGDALAVSRLLTDEGFPISVYFALGTDGLSPDTQKNYVLIKKLSQNGANIQFIDNPMVSEFDIIIDGLFGTGLNSPITGSLADLVEKVNTASNHIYAMDIPSGLNGTNGLIMGTAFEADVTCMFGTRKTGCYFNSGPKVSGERIFCPLPFPEYLMKQAYPVSVLNESLIEQTERKPFLHKYEAGVVYIIGGSPSYTGAAVLSAKAAWSSGCGYVSVATPRGLSHAYDAHLIEQTRLLCGDQQDVLFAPKHAEELRKHIEQKPGVVLIGPGIGRDETTISFVRSFLESYSGKMVIDADALFALSKFSSDIIPNNTECILTPHPGELKTLHNVENPTPDTLKMLLSKYPNPEKTAILAKGMPSIIVSNKRCFITDYDTSPFSRAGFGDVLAGFTAGYFSMGYTAETAMAKALLHGKATLHQTQLTHLSPSNLL